MDIKESVQKAAAVTAWDPVAMLSSRGVRSGHLYTAGLLAVGLSFASWLISRKSKDTKAQSDRWGLFVGEWAPTLIALGIALKHEED